MASRSSFGSDLQFMKLLLGADCPLGAATTMLASAAAGCCLFPSHAPSPARDCFQHCRLHLKAFFRGEYRLRDVLNNSIFLDTLSKLWETAQLPTWKWISVRHTPGHYRDTPFGAIGINGRQRIWMGRAAEIAANC